MSSIVVSGLSFSKRDVYGYIMKYTNHLLFYLTQDMVSLLERLYDMLPRQEWINLIKNLDDWIAVLSSE